VWGPRPVDPTQMHELGAALIAAGLTTTVLRWRQQAGVATFAPLVVLTSLRWIILPPREYEPDGQFEAVANGTLYPAVIIAGVFALQVLRR